MIAALLIGPIMRKRPAMQADSLRASDGGMRWIYIGMGVSSVALLAMLVYILITLSRLLGRPPIRN